VRAGENVSTRLDKNWCLPNQWNLGSVSLGEGGNANGEEEGSEEAGSQEVRQEVLEEEVTTTSSVVFQSVSRAGVLWNPGSSLDVSVRVMYQTTCMALPLGVATTEATASNASERPISHNRNASEISSMSLRGQSRYHYAKEVNDGC
jgi:hypothetical protein